MPWWLHMPFGAWVQQGPRARRSSRALSGPAHALTPALACVLARPHAQSVTRSGRKPGEYKMADRRAVNSRYVDVFSSLTLSPGSLTQASVTAPAGGAGAGAGPAGSTASSTGDWAGAAGADALMPGAAGAGARSVSVGRGAEAGAAQGGLGQLLPQPQQALPPRVKLFIPTTPGAEGAGAE